MALEHKESAELQQGDLRIEQSLLHVETSSEAVNKLTQEAVKAKEKYYDKGYFYVSDVITNYIRETQRSLRTEPDFVLSYQEAMENIDRLNTAMDHLLRLSSGPLPKALLADLGLSPADQARVLRLPLDSVVTELQRLAVMDFERMAWISIFVMANSTAGKTPEHATSMTLPIERILKDQLRGISVPELLADYDSFARKL